MITAIEELSLNAWPALQTVLYDGWVIRFAEGYTKRANSVNPLYPSTIDVQEKLQFSERLYQTKHLTTVFKMMTASQPAQLDVMLQADGYRKVSPTSVQLVDLSTKVWSTAPEVVIEKTLSAIWLENFCRMSAVAAAQQTTLQKILANIVPRSCFVSVQVDDQSIACGLGVLQADAIGLFDIVTDPAFRGRGYGRKLVNAILAWGKKSGATRAYLQVILNNTPAIALYNTLGFTEQYQYWYRIKD